MNVEGINKVLENNDIMVRIGHTWYVLDEIGPVGYTSFPIIVSDDDGGEHEFDMTDVDEFDPILTEFNDVSFDVVGIA